MQRHPFREIGNTLHRNGDSKPLPSLSYELSKPRATLPPMSARLLSPHVDEKHRNDPLYPVDYLKEICEHFRKGELKGRPSVTYMNRLQTDVNEKMRCILIDWLIDVHLKFRLLPETFFLAVEIIDRFLDQKVVSRQKLQLVGVVGLLLAAKYEEIYPPALKDFIYIAANTYTRDDVLRMERLIFQTLNHNLTLPTLYVFVKRALEVIDADTRTRHMAQYISEVATHDYKLLAHLPSLVGASCVYLAHKFLISSKDHWPRTLEYYTGYKLSDVQPCASELTQLLRLAPTQKTQAVHKKYSYAKYSEVSKLAQEACV
eukprot:NODE_2184_length_1257_cov_124.278761_g2076_i0.p1 GENE.NODE_2184_length_1257_cov_124.278761_g2076_i0~~NODE_2184_length_1257_cov_124.278761_g2076_i0.p1  ORF type:complete len:316 (-),score=62.09 NODE_2184_length_1257_cov_124.278761_g2076_i0:243-1190(-)